MKNPALITFEGMAPSAVLRAYIEREAQMLQEQFGDDVICRATIDASAVQSAQQKAFGVRVLIGLPDGREIIVARQPFDNLEHDAAYKTVRHAFGAATHQLNVEFETRSGVTSPGTAFGTRDVKSDIPDKNDTE